MERAGTGIQRMRAACHSNHNQVSFTFSDVFSVEIASNTVDEVTDKVADNQMKILNSIGNNAKITTRQLADDIGISQRKIKENLKKLKEMGHIRRIGPQKGGYWELLSN